MEMVERAQGCQQSTNRQMQPSTTPFPPPPIIPQTPLPLPPPPISPHRNALKEQQQDPSSSQTPEQYSHIPYITGLQSQDQVSTWFPQQKLCYKAITLLRQNINASRLAQILNITIQTVHKIQYQLTVTGKVKMPQKPRPPTLEDFANTYDVSSNNFQPLHPEQQPILKIHRSSNPNAGTRLPNQTAQRIRRILFQVIKQGKIGSYEDMQQILLKEGINRSLSSIYRYIAAIKLNYPQYKDMVFVMYRKDLIGGQPQMKQQQ